MVKVLPLPVTPSSTWVFSPSRDAATSSAIAVGWSPARLVVGDELEPAPAERLLGALRLVRNEGGGGVGFLQPAADDEFGHAEHMENGFGVAMPVRADLTRR